MPYVYLLRCGDDSLYAGVTLDLERRLRQHRAGRASSYTRSHLPVRLVWTHRVRSWSLALQEEHRIKRLTRVEKERLIATGDRHRARPDRRSPRTTATSDRRHQGRNATA